MLQKDDGNIMSDGGDGGRSSSYLTESLYSISTLLQLNKGGTGLDTQDKRPVQP